MPLSHIKNLTSDLLLFITPSLLFNVTYHIKFHAIFPDYLLNLYLVLLIWVSITSLRLVFAIFITRNKMPLVNFILIAPCWLILMLFYLLCYIGLSAWGKVPTVTLIKAYLGQITVLLDTLNINIWMLSLFTLIVLALLLFLYKLVWSKTLWLSFIAHKLHRSVSLFTFISIGVIGLILFWQNFYYSFNTKNEVFLEVFFPEFSAQLIQDWRISSSKTLELKEQCSRAQYIKSINYQPKNVVFIVVDALRADHLSVNGYSRKTTPFIDSLTQSGTLVSSSPVRSVCAESTCGLLALARSKYPNAMTSVDFSLYELLKQYGYKNYFILSGDHTNFYHMKETYSPNDIYMDGSSVEKRFSVYVNDDGLVIKALKKVPNFDGTPTFIQFHLMSVHGLGLRFKQDFPYSPEKNYYNKIVFGTKNKQALAINYYDNGVQQVDSVIKDIFSLLKEKGYLQNTIVVITGDHGDLLGEKGLYSHAHTIEEPVLNIPFIIWSSKKNDPSIDLKKWPIASQVDIAPTVLYALNINIPSSWQGVPLQNTLKNRTIFAAQGNDVGVYASYNDVVFKLTLDKNTATEQNFVLKPLTLELNILQKTIIPPKLLKAMRIQLYKIDS